MAQGWVKMHRQIVESDIYQLSPLYLRLFERLIIETNHEDVETPFKAYQKFMEAVEDLIRGEK